MPLTPRTVSLKLYFVFSISSIDVLSHMTIKLSGELEARIGEATAELRARLAALDNEGGVVREKVQLLEDAHTLQVLPSSYHLSKKLILQNSRLKRCTMWRPWEAG